MDCNPGSGVTPWSDLHADFYFNDENISTVALDLLSV
jgi:hypothetical protein